MELQDAIHNRRSIRRFKKKPVEWEKIGRLIEAGMAAPSAGNIQDVKYIVVLDEGARKEIAKACLNQVWMEKAPVLLVLCSDFQKTVRFYGLRGERLYTIQNSAAAAQNILLAAHDFGLGSCWIGAFNEDMLKATLNIPDYARPHLVIALGYPDGVVAAPEKMKIEHCVFINKYWGKFWSVETEPLKMWSPHVEKGVDVCKDILSDGMNKAQEGSRTLGDKLSHHAGKLKDKIKKSMKKK